MDGVVKVESGANEDAPAGRIDSPDFDFLPQDLTTQCRSLIEGYHELHGYSRLPDILWKAGLGPFIETHREFRLLLKKASTTRSAKKSNEGFTQIAATLLSLEILASHFAGWSTLYPQAASRAEAILKRYARSSHRPLMESYLYPPKHVGSVVIATLIPPTGRTAPENISYVAPTADGVGRQSGDVAPITRPPT
jgi:hypothetical protein